MSFKGLILTNNGRNELAKAEAGEIFQIESIALGDGQYDGAYTDMEAMANQVMLIPSAKITRKENEVYVDVEFSSQDVPKAFYFREIGIIANSKLCFYDNCGQDAEYIDPESNNFIKQKRLRMILCISSDALVNVQIRSQLYALEEDLQLHTGKKDNPHDVTKAQIGLGNADNTADVDKPVSTAQGQAIKEVYEQSAGYTDKKVGELINGAPSTLDTLKEIADAMAENETVVSALNDAIGTKANQAEMENSIKTIQADLSQKLSVSGDASSTTVTFAEAGAMAELTGGETMNNLFGKLKLTVKNMLAVLKLLGKTDISAIGDGTVTGAIGALNSNLLSRTETFEYYSGIAYGDEACKNAILASPHTAKPHILLVTNNDGMNECLYGIDMGSNYSGYLLVSYYRNPVYYREYPGGILVEEIITETKLLLKKGVQNMYGHFIYTGLSSGLFVPMDSYNLTMSQFYATNFALHGIAMGITVDSIVKTANGILFNHMYETAGEAFANNGASGIVAVTVS